MTLDPRARRLLDMLVLSAPATSVRLTTQQRREGFAKLMQMAARPVAIARTQDLTIPGPGGPLALRLYDPRSPGTKPAPALVFFHGGGLVAGDLDTHDGVCRHLANASGTIVIAADYRLAPEARFPAGLIDAAFAVDWVAHEAPGLGIDASRLAVGGESAGALLAALIACGHQRASARLKAQLLLCPVIDLAGNAPSREEFGKGYLIDRDTVERDIEDCLAAGQSAPELPSPLCLAAIGQPPPAIVDIAECDPFRDEAEAYVARLREVGVAVERTLHAGMPHAFHGLSALLPQADPALHAAGRKLAELLSAP